MYVRFGKRALDLLLLLVGAPLLVPVAAVVALLVAVRLGRPVLFEQQRPGLDGAPFLLRKFRSMTEARDAAGDLLPDAERLTAFGRWLRRTSLDELPELWNVLRGEMSAVGPRPLLMAYLERYDARQARRHEVRPGITGWAQVNGRNAITWEEKLELDVWYVEHVRWLLDLRILARSVRVILGGGGISASGHSTMPEFEGREES
jgi:sugar transferase EpsL